MKLLSICIAGLCFFCGAFAETPRIAEYCAKILDDSTYVPLLIKDLDEPIKEWNNLDCMVVKMKMLAVEKVKTMRIRLHSIFATPANL